ncbi:DUF2125 domain-containing protein [Terasakiella pusilla]|uniref:DUF2125 domain-containing protein n=1 Tax=Terasakiella pusilla TaxID=64973 RepID=UPI003AA7AC66
MARVPHPTKKHPALTYQEPTLVKVGRYSLTTFLVLVVLSLLYVGAWFLTSMQLRSGLQDWFAARQANGYLAHYAEKSARISGFPFSVKATLQDVVFAPPKNEFAQHPWVWSPSELTFSITPLPWTIRTLNIDLSARQTFSINNQSYSGTAETALLSLDWMSKGLPDEINLSIQKLSLAHKTLPQGVDIQKLSFTSARQSDGNYAFDLTGERATLPVGLRGLGQRLDDIILRGHLNENFAHDGISPSSLIKWRDAGGIMEAQRMHIQYGPLLLQGNGTMALDGDLQPVGAFSARIQGFFETVNSLQRAGVVRGPDASMAKVVLGMLAKQPQNGGPATISLPLTIQNRAFFAGPVQLIDLPILNW